MLVVKKTFLKDFMKEHGDAFFEKLHDEKYLDIVGQFYRLTIDLRQLNAITILDGHPLPSITSILDQMHGCCHFTAFDIKDAFWCCMVAEKDRHKFAFSTHNELLQWIVVPQGSKGGATFFARVVQVVFEGAPKTIAKYQDDVFNFAPDFDSLLAAHHETYIRVAKYNLVLEPVKAVMNYPLLQVLGHIITSGGFRTPAPHRIAAILELSEHMKTKIQVSSFIGLMIYNKDYVPALASLLAPLHDLNRNEGKMEKWRDDIHGHIVRRIKQLLSSAPLLMLPNPAKKFILHVDACLRHGRGIGGTLNQLSRVVPPYAKAPRTNLNKEGLYLHPVAYYSRILTDIERAFSVTKIEAMALHDLIMHFATDIDNGIPFNVHVDHQALVYLITAPATTANKKIMSYILDLQGFQFNIFFTKGSQHLDADAMSRLFRFTDTVDELTIPLPNFGEVQDADLRNLLQCQQQDPDTIRKATDLVRRMCADVDYLDYNPNPHLLFPNHQEAPARPAASLPVQDDIDEDCADFDEFNESPENATANQGHVEMPSPYVLDPSVLRSLANGQQSAINQPTAIDYFTRSSDGALCMAITNRFTDETTIRPLPTSDDAHSI